jgi:hypothetical protein
MAEERVKLAGADAPVEQGSAPLHAGGQADRYPRLAQPVGRGVVVPVRGPPSEAAASLIFCQSASLETSWRRNMAPLLRSSACFQTVGDEDPRVPASKQTGFGGTLDTRSDDNEGDFVLQTGRGGSTVGGMKADILPAQVAARWPKQRSKGLLDEAPES